jgi:hypothetical protein
MMIDMIENAGGREDSNISIDLARSLQNRSEILQVSRAFQPFFGRKYLARRWANPLCKRYQYEPAGRTFQ